jgi:hypothetical protein
MPLLSLKNLHVNNKICSSGCFYEVKGSRSAVRLYIVGFLSPALQGYYKSGVSFRWLIQSYGIEIVPVKSPQKFNHN